MQFLFWIVTESKRFPFTKTLLFSNASLANARFIMHVGKEIWCRGQAAPSRCSYLRHNISVFAKQSTLSISLPSDQPYRKLCFDGCFLTTGWKRLPSTAFARFRRRFGSNKRTRLPSVSRRRKTPEQHAKSHERVYGQVHWWGCVIFLPQ